MPDEAPQTAAEAAAALERAVPMLVRWFTRSDVKRAMLGDAEPTLSWTDAWLLGRITDTGPVRISALADWQEVDRSTMTTQLRRLENLGLVERSGDPQDGRAVLVRATRAGVARHGRTKQTARRIYRGLLDDWSDDDLRTVAEAARRLTETLERPRTPPRAGGRAATVGP
ncbi:MarR family transcriptional regulator [Nocardioides sp. TF02-7]|uniref:MarR family winged helix-turn-helix transcriptional regulator n=1 Tax=Nocardioides sp. TF02-7 TaxID=2917724 RepID=UPI001F05B650|nr:MarR family transcriptional regulator [Nocardioides sp. TF02-7]UMG91398.1 MarR family transcriptional regulator [Nocardioides sp. TF02-7]